MCENDGTWGLSASLVKESWLRILTNFCVQLGIAKVCNFFYFNNVTLLAKSFKHAQGISYFIIIAD